MTALLDRLTHLRSLDLPPNLGHGLHPLRLLKFARAGAVAPVSLLNDFGERRRIAALAAQMADLSITITDATIAMFERLTGQLFSRSRNRQAEVWRMGKTKVGKLMQLFGASIDAMARSQAALDADVGKLAQRFAEMPEPCGAAEIWVKPLNCQGREVVAFMPHPKKYR